MRGNGTPKPPMISNHVRTHHSSRDCMQADAKSISICWQTCRVSSRVTWVLDIASWPLSCSSCGLKVGVSRFRKILCHASDCGSETHGVRSNLFCGFEDLPLLVHNRVEVLL